MDTYSFETDDGNIRKINARVVVSLSGTALREIARAIASDISFGKRYCRVIDDSSGGVLYTVASGAWAEGDVPFNGLR